MKDLRTFFLRVKGEDKRKFVRLAVHHLLKYKVLKKPENSNALSFVRNISAGGVLFYTKEYTPLDSTIELEIMLPGTSEPVRVLSKVMRVNFLRKVGGFSVGVEFINLDAKTTDSINKKILNVYKKEREKGGRIMRALSASFFILAIAGAVLGFVIRFSGVQTLVSPIGWISMVNMILLFSIALSLLAIARK